MLMGEGEALYNPPSAIPNCKLAAAGTASSGGTTGKREAILNQLMLNYSTQFDRFRLRIE